MLEHSPRSDARARYEAVARATRHNRCGAVPGCTARHQPLLALVAHGRYDPGGVRASLQAAVETGDLLCIRRDGRVHYAVVDEQSLLAVVEAEVGRDDPDRELIARCNDLLDEVRG